MKALIRTRRYLIAGLIALSPLAAMETVAQDAEPEARVVHLDKQHTLAQAAR